CRYSSRGPACGLRTGRRCVVWGAARTPHTTGHARSCRGSGLRGCHRTSLCAVGVKVRVQAPTEEVRPVPVRAGVADVERVRCIPLDGERVDDVVRIELATLLELDAAAQRA